MVILLITLGVLMVLEAFFVIFRSEINAMSVITKVKSVHLSNKG